ncbi:MAG TPA: D-alanyl carrier protein [Ruminococcus sp.]|nr:D-alanyl carrier protein [Ruminococcus sp.]
MNIEQNVREFLGTFFDVDQVKDTDNIFELGLVNSLFAMQLVNYIEQEFDVTVENEELDIENFRDVRSICNLVKSKLDEA